MRCIFLLVFAMWWQILASQSYAQPKIDSIRIEMTDFEMIHSSYNDDGHGNTSSETDSQFVKNMSFVIAPFSEESMRADSLILKSTGNWPIDVGGDITMQYDSSANVVKFFDYFTTSTWGIAGHSITELRFANSQPTGGSNILKMDLDSSELAMGKFFYRFQASGKTGTGNAQGGETRILRVTSTSHLTITFFGTLPLNSVSQKKEYEEILCTPNPSSNFITVTMKNGIMREISFFDILGRTMLKYPINIGAENVRLDISSLPPGIYYLRGGNQMQKFVIQR